ncbi:MAG: nitroreductase family protein [Acidimicrobiales bacterium]
MQFQEVLRRRRTTRNFEDRPIPGPVLDRVLAAGLRGPSAGFSQGTDLVVLEGPHQTEAFWATTTDPGWRATTVRHAGALHAPVIVVPLADAQAYTRRYSEPDKAGSGLDREDAWPAPYWLIDTAFSAMLLQLAAIAEGLGVFFFGIFRGEAALKASLGVPDHLQPLGAIALGWPAPDMASPSVGRGHRPAGEVIHRGRW